nr:MAG TPA: hypothetical protein [Caudoviricetes sp.]
MKFFRSEISDCLYHRGVIFSLQNFFCAYEIRIRKIGKGRIHFRILP